MNGRDEWRLAVDRWIAVLVVLKGMCAALGFYGRDCGDGRLSDHDYGYDCGHDGENDHFLCPSAC